MKNKLKLRLERHMIRPAIYHGATKFGIAMLAALLWHRFANPNNLSLNTHGFFFLSVFFVLLAWLLYLRADGLRMPRLKLDFLKKLKKKPMRSFGDMADYIDEEVVSFDELDDDEKDACRFLADIACALIFLVLSFF